MDDDRTRRLAKDLLPAIERQYPFWPLSAWGLHLAAFAGPVVAVILRLKGLLLILGILMWLGVVAAFRLLMQSRREQIEAHHVARSLDAMLDRCEADEKVRIQRRTGSGLLRKQVRYVLVDPTDRQAEVVLEITAKPILAEAIDVALHKEAERIRQGRVLGDFDHEAMLSRLAEVTHAAELEDAETIESDMTKPDQKSPESH